MSQNENVGRPSDDAWFWHILESSNRSMIALCRQLERLSKEDLRRYHASVVDAKHRVDPYYNDDLWDFFDQDPDTLSEDGADDFAAWAVMEGRSFFEEVVANPSDILRYVTQYTSTVGYGLTAWNDEVDREEYRGYQRADGIEEPILRTRFREELDPDEEYQGEEVVDD